MIVTVVLQVSAQNLSPSSPPSAIASRCVGLLEMRSDGYQLLGVNDVGKLTPWRPADAFRTARTSVWVRTSPPLGPC